LDTIGFPWKGVALAESWDKKFEALKRFREAHGHCRPARRYRAAGVLLADWCNLQRKHWRAGTLARDRIRKLSALGFEWEPNENSWKIRISRFGTVPGQKSTSLAAGVGRACRWVRAGELVLQTAQIE
jgi:hypothetical protein